MFTHITIPNFLSKKECSDIINISLNNLNLIPAKIGNGNNLGFDTTYRNSNVAFTKYDNTFPYLKDKIKNVISEFIRIKGYELLFDSNFQFTEYQTGGHYEWHTDSGGILSNRYCSLVIQLNEEYIGGDLKVIVNNEEIILERGIGNMFVFLSSLEHKVEKITEGKRYSLVNWFELKELSDFKKTLI